MYKPLHALLTLILAAQQVFLFLPQFAFAQLPQPRVWLGPIRAEQGAGGSLMAEKFDEATRARLQRSQKLRLTDQGRSASVNAGEADPRVGQAETLRVAAKEAFRAKSYKDALEKLRIALGLYEEALASVNKLEVLAETLGYLGAISLELGYDRDAKDYFKRVVAMAPEAEPLDEYSQAAQEFFKKQKKKLLKKKKKANLQIKSVPPGALIRVDGVERGKAPLKVKGLLRGEHYIQASLEGSGLAGQRIRAKGGRVTEVKLILKSQVGPAPSAKASAEQIQRISQRARVGDLGLEFRTGAEEIAKTTQADYVVLAFITPGKLSFGLSTYLYGLKEQQVAALEPLSFGVSLQSISVQADRLARNIEAAVTQFPFDKAVVGMVKVLPKEPDPPPASVPVLAPASEPLAKGINFDGPLCVCPDPLCPHCSEEVKEPDDEPWYGAWWIWTAAGVVVIGGTAAGGYYLLQDDPSNNRYDATVRWGN